MKDKYFKYKTKYINLKGATMPSFPGAIDLDKNDMISRLLSGHKLFYKEYDGEKYLAVIFFGEKTLNELRVSPNDFDSVLNVFADTICGNKGNLELALNQMRQMKYDGEYIQFHEYYDDSIRDRSSFFPGGMNYFFDMCTNKNTKQQCQLKIKKVRVFIS